MPIFDLGDGVPLRHLVKDSDQNLTDASVSLGFVKPDGTTVPGSVTHPGLGTYEAFFVPDQVGEYSYVWTISGPVTDVSYGSFVVALTAPQSYTTVALVKEALSKPTVDDRDELIDIAIRAASRKLDQVTGRRFYADRMASTRTFPLMGRVFETPYGVGVTVDDIASETGLALASGSYGQFATIGSFYPGPDNAIAAGKPITYLQLDSAWITGGVSHVQVTARWGWPTVPDEVQLATQLLAARLYRRKDSPQGVISSGDWGSVRVSRVDPDVEALISNFILPGFA